MRTLLFAALLALTEGATTTPKAKPAPVVHTVSGLGALADMSLSLDGSALYLLTIRDGEQALSLLDLTKGTVSRVSFGPERLPWMPQIAAARNGVLVSVIRTGGVTNAQVLFVDTERGQTRVLVDEEASPAGRVSVSPSGRFFAVGTQFGCSGGGRNCFASSVGVYAVATGERLLTVDIPTDESRVDDSSGARVEEPAVSPHHVEFLWTDKDEFILDDLEQREPGLRRRVFREISSDGWRLSAKHVPAGHVLFAVAEDNVPMKRGLTVRTREGTTERVTIDASSEKRVAGVESSEWMARGNDRRVVLARTIGTGVESKIEVRLKDLSAPSEK